MKKGGIDVAALPNDLIDLYRECKVIEDAVARMDSYLASPGASKDDEYVHKQLNVIELAQARIAPMLKEGWRDRWD